MIIRADVATANLNAGSDLNADKDPSNGSKTLDEIDNQIDNEDPARRRAQLDPIIIGLKRIDERKTTYRIAGHDVVWQDQVVQAVKWIQWAKGWIDEAVQVSPQASVAWAAVSLFLPLLTRPATAEKASIDGFMHVTSRMRYYVALERLMLPQSQGSKVDTVSEDLKNVFEAHVVDLYQHILNFQLKCVLRFYQVHY